MRVPSYRKQTIQAEYRGERLLAGDRKRGVDRAVGGAGLQYPKQVLYHSGCVRDQRADQTGWPIGAESALPGSAMR